MSVAIPSLRGAIAVPGWAKNELWRRAKAVPSLDLRFAENRSLVDATTGLDLVTFSRTSDATFVGSNGLIQTASAGTPRFDHNPLTGESLGLLVEEQRTNLLLRSEEFDNASWSKTGLVTPVSANVETAPDGTSTADLLVEAATTGAHLVDQAATYQLVPYTASVYMKQHTAGRFGFIRFSNTNSLFTTSGIIVNLATGALVNSSGVTSFSIVSAGNGWWRVSITATPNSAGTAAALHIGITTSTNIALVSYTGDGTSGIYLWGAQLEAGAFPTSYIPTGASAVTRAADVCSISGSNLTSWLNVNEGSFFAEAQSFQTTATANIAFAISDGTLNNRIDLNVRAGSLGGASRGIVQSGGSTSFDTGNIATPAFTPNLAYRQAIGYQLDNFVHVYNGDTPRTDVSGAVPVAMTILDIGSRAGSSLFLNGHIRRLVYWRERLANNVLQSITQ
jgi:hypothetical protein